MNLKEIKNRPWYKPVITFLQILIDIIGVWLFSYLLYVRKNNFSDCARQKLPGTFFFENTILWYSMTQMPIQSSSLLTVTAHRSWLTTHSSEGVCKDAKPVRANSRGFLNP